jgi:hypothetical protein
LRRCVGMVRRALSGLIQAARRSFERLRDRQGRRSADGGREEKG